jgi:tripartite-type tricarboxylate transporter receptor subunit TctC
MGENIKAGNLRALAVGSRARLEWLPEVPTIAESGYPGYEVNVWYGLFAPAGTPAAVVDQLAQCTSAGSRTSTAGSFTKPIFKPNDRR